MYTFNKYLEDCKDDVDDHNQNLKRTFEEGWLPLFEQYRTTKTLQLKSTINNIVLSGLIEYNLTNEEAFFILAYTGSYSSWINQPLRAGQLLKSICKTRFAEILEKSLDKLPSFNCNYVYRMDSPDGLSQEVITWFKKIINKIVKVPYFLSTSKDNWESTDIVWKIKTMQANSNARDLHLLTNNCTEKEVLFKRNSYFKVLSVNEKNGIIEMEETDNIDFAYILTGLYHKNN